MNISKGFVSMYDEYFRFIKKLEVYNVYTAHISSKITVFLYIVSTCDDRYKYHHSNFVTSLGKLGTDAQYFE